VSYVKKYRPVFVLQNKSENLEISMFHQSLFTWMYVKIEAAWREKILERILYNT